MIALGIVVAAPFRRVFIHRERLRFPSATATGTLIGALFRRADIIARAGQDLDHQPSSQPSQTESVIEAAHDEPNGEPSDEPNGEPSGEPSDEPSGEPSGETPGVYASRPVDSGRPFAADDIRHAIRILLVSLTWSSLFVSRLVDM